MLTYYVRRASPMAWFDSRSISGMSGGSRLPIDLQEDAEAFELVAAVPGLKAEDIAIEVEDDVITLRGKTTAEVEKNEGEFLLREIGSAEFERRIRLPVPVESAKAKAVVEHGMLKLRIPKAEQARPKMIPVQSR
jgi:HSP20 family protein